MQFPKSLRAEGWRTQTPAQRLRPGRPLVPRDADDVSPPLRSKQLHALTLVAALTALGAGTGLNLIDDPRPLDIQLSAAMRQAGETLKDWQGQLSRGLRVSLRAVADGHEVAPIKATAAAPAAPRAQPPAAADDRDPPEKPDGR